MTKYFQISALTLALALGSHGAFAAQDADDFVEEASAKGVAEVQVGQVAEKEGTSAAVKTFAQMMIKDHTEANAKLKSLAASKKLEVSESPEMLDKVKAMILELRTAKSFDKAYADNQVKAHEETIALFKEQAETGEDADLKAFAKATLPKLEAHLTHAKELAAATGGDTAKK